jgi:hypothetical protein
LEGSVYPFIVSNEERDNEEYFTCTEGIQIYKAFLLFASMTYGMCAIS